MVFIYNMQVLTCSVVAFDWAIKVYGTKPAIINMLSVAIETECTPIPMEMTYEVCSSVCIISSALNRMVISVTSDNNSVYIPICSCYQQCLDQDYQKVYFTSHF